MAADFFMVTTRATKKGTLEIYPKFIVKNRSKDLMIRGGDFYAIWLEDEGRWSLDEQDVIDLIDRELDLYFEQHKDRLQGAKVLHLWDAETGMIDTWHKFCQKQMRDAFHTLDEKIIFSNSEINKKDYASRRLSYPLQDGKCESYDKLMSVLYSPEERMKLEWAIGSIVCGDSKTIQKFLVLYGSAGTGKSTVLNIIQMLFDGYYSVFDAKVLGSTSNAFALEAFKDNPLVAIQHDGDLSRIEDNTRLNSLVSHEKMTVNNKFEKLYSQSFKAFLFMGTNKPVKITDAKSGILRRLIDVSPTGNKVPVREYNKLYSQIKFELGAIAWHCLKVYESNKGMYDDYIPYSMMSSTNDFYNFVEDAYLIFAEQDGVTLKQAWELYKTYCDEAKVWYPLQKMNFKSELKSYFKEFHDIYNLEDGTRCRNYYKGFRKDKFGFAEEEKKEESPLTYILDLKEQHSLLDDLLAEYPAQYASAQETPKKKWDEVTTKLKDLDTRRLHYILGLENHIVIDFDLTDENGNKCLELNIEEASKWPKTYAELSKSGNAVHLHYIYDGDVSKLSSVYADHIEIKVYAGKSALRRKLTKCNDIPVAHISSGLPLRKEPKKMVNAESVKSEMGLRKLIVRNLNKEIHPSTKSSIDFIFKILEDAYAQGLHYDVSDMYQGILEFGMGSTNNADYCIKLVNQMKLKSEEPSEEVHAVDERLIFYDVEVFPNLFLVNWKFQGKSNVVRMINPKPHEIEELVKHRLVGFNCRRYDNHILYARMMGYSEIALFNLSQNIINNGKGFFSEAWNLSYTDVYDFCSKKQSLKKWEIELGIHHQELGLPWDQPVPEELWLKVAEYCDNDVIATEAVFDARHADFVARQILADVAGMTVNDTTNSLTTRIIFGKNKKPQSQFNYRFMGDRSVIDEKKTKEIIQQYFGPDTTFIDEFTVFDKYGRPVFPGYSYENGLSMYRGEEVGEGGYVYAEPDIHTMVGLDDVASMHPSSVVAEELFGEEYTQRFQEILQTRIYIKHQEFDKAKKLLNGALAKYLDDENMAADLAQALKIAINSVYGLTAAKFENPFRDPRNIDNIVAKRGALFMVNLKHAVQEKGYRVAHIKTDSIKIPDATNDILDFVSRYGKMYGYNFEHEATYEKMCLVNDAVYIASYLAPERCEQLYSYIPGDNKKHFKKNQHPWTATGTQFQVPYVFKKLFSHEDILFEDMCETKSVSKGDIYLDMNEDMPDVSEYQKNLDKIIADHKKGKSGMDDANFKEYCFELENEVAAGHNYIFVGRVGSFTPIRPGCGGGVLVNNNGGKWSAVTGTKGYRWLEAEMVKELNKFDDIDESYYISLVDEAKDAIGQYGDFEWFVSDEPVAGPRDFSWLNVPAGIDDEVPFAED